VPSFEIEDSHPGERVCGIDEAGMGSWAGPLVVAGCLFLEHSLPHDLAFLDDSKRLSRSKREALFEVIVRYPLIKHQFAVVAETVIDAVGLAEAWKRGVIEAASPLGASLCIVDGTRRVDIPGIRECLPIIKGDQKSYSIAAASIVAKVIRDRIMQDVHVEFPEYGFDKNVGYGTKLHMNSISKFGICRSHRRSYAPIRDHESGESGESGGHINRTVRRPTV
jgi:ribonuclease HII